jgi:nucleoside-diphosphate-sugar epimerase
MRFPADMVARLRARYEGVPVCVTGGAGFIGGHLVDALLSLGANIAVIDDLSGSSLQHLAELIEMEPERVRFVRGSILDDDALAEAMGGAKLVFHLAALGSVPRSVKEPQRTWSVNATGTVRVLEAARNAKSARVLYAGSSSAYGDDPTMPKMETHLPQPLSPYAVSKLAGEQLLFTWAKGYGLSAASLRLFNVFGPRQRADSAYAAVVAAFAKKLLAGSSPVIYGDGQQSRDFTFVSNAVMAFLLAGASDRALAGEVMNVGTGRRVTLQQLASLMAARCGAEHVQPTYEPARAGDVRHSLADISRARELIDYRPIASLEEGLDETVAWYRKAPAESLEGNR